VSLLRPLLTLSRVRSVPSVVYSQCQILRAKAWTFEAKAKTVGREAKACKHTAIAETLIAHLLWAARSRPSVADWGDGVSASCTMGQIVR